MRRLAITALCSWILLLGLALFSRQIHAADVLDDQARTWVERQTQIRVAPDPDFAPIDFFDARGRHAGLSADLLRLIAERTGLRFAAHRNNSFDAAREQLKLGKADLLSGVFQTERRAQEMLFSRPYLHLPAALIGRTQSESIEDLETLRHLRVAVVQGHVWQELLQDAGFEAALAPAASLREALLAVTEGRADVYVGDLFTADRAIQDAGLKQSLRVVGQPGLEADLAFAVRSDLPDLKRVLDQALASISVAEESALRARWDGDKLEAAGTADLVPEALGPDLLALKAAVSNERSWNEDQRNAALAKLATADARDAEADGSLVQRMDLLRRAAEARANIDLSAAPEAQQSRAEDLLRWRGSLPQRASVNELEQLLSTEEAARNSLQDALDQANHAASELQQRPAALRRELSALATQVEAISVGDADADLGARVDRVSRQAELRALRARQSLLQAEQNQLDLQLLGLEARKQNLTRSLSNRNERINVLEQLIAELSNSELSAEVERLRSQAEHYASGPSPLRDLARENQGSAELLLNLTQKLGSLRNEVQAITLQANQTHLALTNASARIKIGGITDSIGMMLMAERRKLPNLSALRAQQAQMRSHAADAQLAQIALSEEREQLVNIPKAMATRLSPLGDADTPMAPERRAQLSDLLLLRGQLLPRLQQQYLRLQELLVDADAQLEKLIADAAALGILLEQNLLWVPSHPPVSGQWTGQAWEQWQDLVKPSRWQAVFKRVANRLPEKPLWILGLLLPIVIILLRPMIDRQLADLASHLRIVRQDRYRYTMHALLLTMLRATPMMLFSLWAGHILQSVGDAGRFTHSLGLALWATAPHIYFLTLIVAICRDQGLAQAHLRWPRARRAAILRLRPYLYAGVLPLLWLASICLARDLDTVNGTLLRPVLMLLHLILAGFSWWLLRSDHLMSIRGGGDGRHPSLRRWLRVGLTLAFLVMAALPLFGFVLTSGILLQVSFNTLEVLLAVSLAHGLTLRWLMLGERRLALAQLQQTEELEKSDRVDAGDASLDAPGAIQESIDVRLASAQSRSLLRVVTVLLLGLGLIWALADVAPAFSMLDRVGLWQTSIVIDGETQMSTVTLGSVVLALAVLLLGVSATRNVPGLLEILLLERFTGDASVRYAIVTVSRYIITFAMMMAVFGLLGLRWGHLQWLAAGFSVGLGFGLQEIFGNFVAGIILLFERPFRVGDVVTIGELSGTVRRIRTRATTIVDFDNKEIVIPNKTFITERFVNWTLSDTTTRIIIKVGVSYASDPVQVREQLLELARAHPAVLREPEPAAVFMAMGASSLDFELRCFVREIGDRLRAMHDLHTSIIERFRGLGIEIAYPQLDLHVRQVPSLATAAST